jgi:hypothetical protein
MEVANPAELLVLILVLNWIFWNWTKIILTKPTKDLNNTKSN